jgi:3-hydroxybutyryl-CoA dehydrogenase
VRSACVIGGGTMGHGIAAACLHAGFVVSLVDVDEAALARSRDAIASRLEKDGAAERGSDLTLTVDLEDAARDVDVAIEAVPERIELKRDVFERLAASTRADTLLATNTSTTSISSIAAAAGDAAPRVIGMHFFNPVHRMALLEIVVADTTATTTLDAALELASRLGKEPIVVRDVPGFVTSRLGLLLGNEAMRIVEDGIASAADVDKAMRLGYRHPMGPLELADLVGLDARLNNVRSIYAQTGLDQYRPPAILERLVAEGRLGRKSSAGFYDYES